MARGAQDADWQPVKDAARQIAFAEDGAIFEGYAAAGIDGIRQGSSNPPVTLPADVTEYPTAIAQALSQLRVAGVDGPYSVVLSADAYTAVSETSDHGYPVIEHIKRLLTGEIIWAPAISGAFVLTTRGGDFSLHLGQDLSIGYLSHTDSRGPPVPAGDADVPDADQRGRGRLHAAGPAFPALTARPGSGTAGLQQDGDGCNEPARAGHMQGEPLRQPGERPSDRSCGAVQRALPDAVRRGPELRLAADRPGNRAGRGGGDVPGRLAPAGCGPGRPGPGQAVAVRRRPAGAG